MSFKCVYDFDVVVVGALEHLGDQREVDSERDAAVAPAVLEAVVAHDQRNKGDVARVHRLPRVVYLRSKYFFVLNQTMRSVG